MLERIGDIWTASPPPDAIIVTTNGFRRKNGSVVMGRGIALEAASLYPGLDQAVGDWVRDKGNRPGLFLPPDTPTMIITMPVKHAWWEAADIHLIHSSATDIANLATTHRLTRIYAPRPGCGNGRLSWGTVRPLLDPVWDHRFTVFTK